MAADKPIYDLMLLLDLEAADAVRDKALADAQRAIEGGGELVGHHDWGVRNLAYEIDHRSRAHYHLLQFHATPTLLESLERSLHIADGVLRFRIIRLEPGTPPPPEVRPEPAAVGSARPGHAGEATGEPSGAPEEPALAPTPAADGAPTAAQPDAAQPDAVEPDAADAPVEAEPPSAQAPEQSPTAG